MTTNIKIFVGLILLISAVYILSATDYIAEDSERWKEMYVDTAPAKTVSKWLVPFITKDRSKFKTISLVSSFGAHRNSFRKGHKHTGTDIIPKKRNRSDSAWVYPMAEGVVCSIHLGDPHKTVVVRHLLKNSKTMFTSYKHITDIGVKPGQQVTHRTRIARLYTKKEARKLGGNYDHLHLEVRKMFDDYGCASWNSMTKAELNKRFFDPWKFMKKRVGK
ncbi:MAG: peptidoglycan DD-metalloendopeptidase family protein [Chlorobi bacterium]|nr:peptidoglycan DD-metalloendopeptidase family protein [Chlorobiota bacterium]